MKHIYILAMALSLSLFSNAQTVIVQWTFPSGTSADSIAGVGIAANSAQVLKAIGTSAIDFSKNGFTTKAAQATGWDNGSGSKYWQVSFSTKGFTGLILSSRQQTGGNNPGPRDFIIQYRLGNSGTWNEIPDGTIVTANDWTTAYVNNLSLPAECDEQDLVFVRWLMNSNISTSVTGDLVTATGISKIDEILITADINTAIEGPNPNSGISLFPNPVNNNMLTIQSDQQYLVVTVFDLQGKIVKTITANNGQVQIETSLLHKGMYIAHILTTSGTVQKKFIIE
ncbi:MAG TPA: T9SS type A sorting domain-containing protein [Bacteroidales bacterium]|jgi:Secretion system C-terminal sorting domain